MAILKELFSTLNEKKVGDEEYFITYYEHSGKKKVPSRIELYTEKAYKSFDAAERALEKFKNDIGNSRDDDTDAADDERDLLDDCSITRGAILKRDHPKLFEHGLNEGLSREWKKIGDNEGEKHYKHKTHGHEIKVSKSYTAYAQSNGPAIKTNYQDLSYKKADSDKWTKWGEVKYGVTDSTVKRALDLKEAKDEDDCVSSQCHAQAVAKSKAEGVVQHVNKDKKTGKLYVSDWFDDDETVASYNKGKKVNESLNKKKEGELLFLVKSRKKNQEVKVYAKDKAQALDRVAVHDGNGWFTGPQGTDVTAVVVKEAQDSKGREIKAGDRLVWVDGNGEHTGTVSADPKYNGGLKVAGRSVKNIIDDADKVTVLKEARSIPSWFKDGAKVKLMPEYADKDPNEVFTLKSVDTETGKGRVTDDQGKGWGISYYQVYPKNKTPSIHESEISEELKKETCEMPNGQRPKGIGWSLKKAGEQSGKSISVWERTTKSVKEADEGNHTFTKKDDGKVGRYGVKVGQVYVPADGSKNELKVLSINHASEDALVFDKAQNKEWHIDLFKLAKVRYSLKEDAALQGLGKSLAGKAPAAPSDGVDVPMGDADAEPAAAPPSDTEVKGDADDASTPAEFKVGDVVKTLVGPHKGQEHDVTKVYPDGRMDLKPKGLEGTAVKYRNGGTVAKPDQVVLAESILRGSKTLLRTITIDLTEAAAKDGIMPLSYRPAKGHKIEAYGRKGMKNTMWRKFFKDSDAMSKWCDENDATVEGSRDLDKDELK